MMSRSHQVHKSIKLAVEPACAQNLVMLQGDKLKVKVHMGCIYLIESLIVDWLSIYLLDMKAIYALFSAFVNLF